MRPLVLLAFFALGCASTPRPAVLRADERPSERARRRGLGCFAPDPEFRARGRSAKEDARFMREIAPRALTASEEATLAEASRLLGDDPSPTPDVAALRWRRARIYLAAHHWIEAGVALHELAFEHVGTDAGLDAAIPYLEALDVLGSRASPPRATCYDDMSADVPRLVELHCGAEARRWSPPCRTLTQILVDLTRIRSS